METCKDSVAIEDMVMQLVEMSVRAVSESVITGIKKDFPTFEVKVSEFLNLIHADAQSGVTVVTGIEGSSIFRNFAVLPGAFDGIQLVGHGWPF